MATKSQTMVVFNGKVGVGNSYRTACEAAGLPSYLDTQTHLCSGCDVDGARGIDPRHPHFFYGFIEAKR